MSTFPVDYLYTWRDRGGGNDFSVECVCVSVCVCVCANKSAPALAGRCCPLLFSTCL